MFTTGKYTWIERSFEDDEKDDEKDKGKAKDEEEEEKIPDSELAPEIQVSV
jgi:poly [ADP-ribose] polymerase 2/3/4